MNKCQIASRNSEEYTTFEVVEAKWGWWNQNWLFRLEFPLQSVMKIQKRTISTSVLNSHFQTIIRGQSESTWLMWCVVLFFFGRWNVFCAFCFSWRNKDNNWSMCSAGGMSENLGVHEVIQGLQKEHVLVLHLAPPSFTKLFVHYSVVANSLKINHLSTSYTSWSTR